MFRSSLAVVAPMAALSVLIAQGAVAQGMAAGAAQTNATTTLPAGIALDGGLVPIHTGNDDPDLGAYGVWAAAAGYKVSFHGDMTFIPYLGSEYPENQPLSWRTASVRLGNGELMTLGEQPGRWHSKTRYEYRYEAFTEAYDVREEGLEQSFVIHRRPRGRGDLVVTGRLDTRMRAGAVAQRHQGLVFADAQGQELVRYGEAFAIDAAGRRCEMSTRYDGTSIQLTVPGDWLGEAKFPVTIDPLLQPVSLRTSGRIGSADVARDSNNNQLMVVFVRAASLLDYDVYGQLCQDDFSGGRTVFFDTSSTWNSPQVRVASAGTQQHYCIAFERRTATARRVAYHIHTAGNFTSSMSFQTLSTGLFNSVHHWRPDVGGTIQSAPGGFVIVCQQEGVGRFNPFRETSTSTVRATVLDLSGGVQHALTLQPAVAGTDMERPTINQNARNRLGVPTWWMVAWQEYRASLVFIGRWGLAARQVGSDGSASSTAWQDFASGYQRLGPVLDGMDGRYLLSYTRSPTNLVASKPVSVQGHSVVARRVNWSPGANTFSERPEHVVWNGNTRSWVVKGCSHDYGTDSHWAIAAYNDSSSTNGGTGNAHIARVGFNGRVTESQVLARRNVLARLQAVAGGVTYDEDADQFVAVYSQFGSLGAAYGTKFAYRTPLSPAVSGSSCSSGSISWFGSSQIGSEFPRVRLTSRAANQPAFLLVALATSNTSLGPFGMTGCNLLVANGGPAYVGLATTSTDASGSASLQMRLPEFLSRGLVYFQWFHGAPSANALNLRSSQRLRIEIIK